MLWDCLFVLSNKFGFNIKSLSFLICFERLALLRTTLLFLWIVSLCSSRYSDSLQAAIDFSTERFHLPCFKFIVLFKSAPSTAAHYLVLILQAVVWRGWKNSCTLQRECITPPFLPLQTQCYEVIPFLNEKTQIRCSKHY